MATPDMEIFDETVLLWGAARSADDERWVKAGDTQEEAEAWVRANYDTDDAPPGAVLGFIAEARWVSPSKVVQLVVDLDELLERMEETDGIAADDSVFETHNRVMAENALRQVLSAWAAVHLQSTSWQLVGESIEVRSLRAAAAAKEA